MNDVEKSGAWQRSLLSAVNGAFKNHPDCLFGFDFREYRPEAKDLLNPRDEPEIVGEVYVTIYRPL